MQKTEPSLLKETFLRFAGSRPAALPAAALLLAVIGWLDYRTGVEISFSIFYLLPISLTAWNYGVPGGALMACAGAASFFLLNYTSGSEYYSGAAAPYLNTLTELTFYLITAWLVARQRTFLRRLSEEVALKTAMVSMVSHEFNNAMSKVNLSTAMLEETETPAPDGQRARYYGILKTTSSQLIQMTRTFLNKARLEAGRLTLEIRPVELRRLVGETLESLRLLSEDKGVAVSTDFPPEIIPIAADPDALSLAVNNLIGNAVKYTRPGGKVVIRIAETGDGRAVFSVEDTGIGIQSGDLEKVLSGFYRSGEGKTAAAGFGVGLKVTRELIEAHGSRLQVESEPGKGSKFFFSLPVHKERF
jgi:signal transduction histidine kinase